VRPALVGVPYDASSSFLRGAAGAPAAIRDALHSRAGNPWAERLVEVAPLQVIAQPLEGGVVVEQGAQQRLFGLDIGRRMRDDDIVGRGTKVERGDKGHSLSIAQRRPLTHGQKRAAAALPTRTWEAVDKPLKQPPPTRGGGPLGMVQITTSR